MKQRISIVASGLVIMMMISCLNAWAGDIKQRMKDRLPRIVELKAQGVIGETASGYLDYVTSARPDEGLIQEENADRKSVYQAIASQQGVSLDRVEKLRAQQIVDKANPGEFLKNESGAWRKK